MSKRLSLLLLSRFYLSLLPVLLLGGLSTAQAVPAAERAAVQRLQEWRRLQVELADQPIPEKLHQVNRFFNERIRYAEDADLWNAADYWASTEETLERGAGDCEDLALAKYFTLRKLNIAEEQLRLVYTTLKQNGQAHMILAYWPESGGEPLIMDNLDAELAPLSRRSDLRVEFAFDADHLYTFEQDRLWPVAPANLLQSWQKLLLSAQQAELTLAQARTR